MYQVIFLAAPFALATVLTAMVGATWSRCRALLGLGVVLAVAFVLYAYFSSPPDREHDTDQCNHCQQLIGRWWEPVFVAWLTVVAYFAWSVGIATGAALGALASTLRKRFTSADA